ncbi:MAG: hypothetical protein H6922_04720 [Pseudomonadaceae bacterium]|nr:hypothetical protein [Pseudomonadaceae bacterium]
METWVLLSLVFSVFGAVIISYNHVFKIDGRELVIWRSLGILPLAVAAWWWLPWPTEWWFYAISVGLGVASMVGDVLLMNAAAAHGGRLSSMYVPMKMLWVFALWVVVDPASAAPLLEAPWKLAVVLGCFGLAAYGIGHIRRNDVSVKALLAVVPVALIFGVEDVIEKYVLPGPPASAEEMVGATLAMLSVMFLVAALPAMVWLGGFPRWNTRTVLASVGFGVLLMVGIGILLVAFVLSPNPGYVGAITALSTVWLALWARVRQGERNNMVAILMLVAAAVGVAVVAG